MAHILVIDDDDMIRDLLMKMLERLGHQVDLAADGMAGVQQYTANRPDLVITDILMPEKEGIETILELRKIHPDVKILAISGGGAVGPDTYLNMARELGADRTLSKPFDMEALVKVLNDLL